MSKHEHIPAEFEGRTHTWTEQCPMEPGKRKLCMTEAYACGYVYGRYKKPEGDFVGCLYRSMEGAEDARLDAELEEKNRD